MVEEAGEPADDMTRQSQEKPWCPKVKSWFGRHPKCSLLALLLGGTLGLALFFSCSFAAMAVAWPVVEAVKARTGFPSHDIFYIGVPVIGGMLGTYFCVYCGRWIVQLIQSASGRAAACLRNPICRASVMVAALCGAASLTFSLSSLPVPQSGFSWPWTWQVILFLWSWGWRVMLLGLCAFVFSVILRLIWRPVKEWMGRLPLFVAIAIWVVLAAGLLAVLVYWWGGWPTAGSESGADVSSMTKNGIGIITVNTDQGSGAFEAVKSALTAVAGIGGVAYLVIKYRTEQRETAGIADRKISAAVDQLGSDKASTRIAGVYALTDIADTYKGVYRQRVVNILCGYLRSDRTEYALDEFGHTIKDDSGRLIESEDSDEAMESTILGIFATHLKKERRSKSGDPIVRQLVRNDQLWCDCDFDLHGAVFHESASFEDFTFNGRAHFRKTKFTESAVSFRKTRFDGDADFVEAQFKGYNTNFQETRFGGESDFSDAEFGGDADFSHATFIGKTDFKFAQFKQYVEFPNTRFATAPDFTGANFAGNANFQLAVFEEGANFSTKFFDSADFTDAEFGGDAEFNGAVFRDHADFRRTRFKANAVFEGVTFEDAVHAFSTDFTHANFAGKANFHGAGFNVSVDFQDAEFGGDAEFSWASFEKWAGFQNAKFKVEADFSNATFKNDAQFSKAVFGDRAGFQNAKFREWAQFPSATFVDCVEFIGAAFQRNADFEKLVLNKPDGVSFDSARFNREYRDISHAYKWGPIPENNNGLPKGAVWASFSSRRTTRLWRDDESISRVPLCRFLFGIGRRVKNHD